MAAAVTAADDQRKRKRKRRRTRNYSKDLPVRTIPLDLIQEILPRLPAKAFARLRCVSKSFHSLLADQCLILKQAIHANKKAEHQRLLCAFGDYRLPYTIKLGTAAPRSRISDHLLKELPWWISDSVNGNTYFVGSCCGLVCVSIWPYYWVFNPLTRESYKVLGIFSRNCISASFYGFGFDLATEDYKIVRGNVRNFSFSVFSLKNNKWISKSHELCPFGEVPCLELYKRQVATVNGALHWNVDRNGNSTSIISFDLAEEELREIMLPPKEGRFVARQVGVLQGQLSVSCICWQTQKTCVWVMEEYGLVESWKKLLMIQLPNDCCPWIPICYTGKSRIIFQKLGKERRLKLYDPEDKSLSDCWVPKSLPRAYWYWTATYVETLVSIKELQGRK